MKKKILKVLTIVFTAILGAFLILVSYLTITEFKPNTVEQLIVESKGEKTLQINDSISVLTWNIGYGALGDNADFFMDGGKMVYTSDAKRVQENIDAINKEITSLNPDVIMLQEVDINSKRSNHINEREMISNEQVDYCHTFANNFKVNYVPYPLPTIGKVDSGLLTLSKYQVSESERRALPCPFNYPVRIANLKRCLLVNRVPVEKSDKELVLVNLHLEAYDDGKGKIEQTRMLKEYLQQEVDKGNYVIAAGDFNQVFSGIDENLYPIINEDYWKPGVIDTTEFGDDLHFEVDGRVPSCRLLNEPYDYDNKDNFQHYLIDGYIVSSNIEVEFVETLNLKFKNADHNPVLLKLKLK